MVVFESRIRTPAQKREHSYIAIPGALPQPYCYFTIFRSAFTALLHAYPDSTTRSAHEKAVPLSQILTTHSHLFEVPNRPQQHEEGALDAEYLGGGGCDPFQLHLNFYLVPEI
jgi:hypothetical protein